MARKKKETEQDAARKRKNDFLKLALTRFQLASDAEADWRREGLDDLKFSVGRQWAPTVESQRQLDGRPCLVMNRLPQFMHQITNQQRQQQPAVQINPVGSGADVKIAEVIQGLFRHIEINSEAEVAYDHALDLMVSTGKGAWRIVTDYLTEDGDEQDIYIRWIENIFALYGDPNAKLPDRSDKKWAFIVSDMPKPDFLEEHHENLGSASDYESTGDAPPDWVSKDTIRVAEYFYIEEYSIPQENEEGDMSAEDSEETDSPAPMRKKTKKKVKWAKITAHDILEESTWPGTIIPIVEVFGTDLLVDGKKYLAGMVRDAKDPQRMYNYWASAATEAIALAPRAPFVGAKGQFEGQEEKWKQANNRNMAYLEYIPTSIAGQQVGPPVRSTAEPPIQSMVLMLKQADNDLKNSIGIFDASLGQKGPEQSGLAIERRQQQGEISTLNYSDNLARAMRLSGRIIMDVRPKIYDTPRIQRIILPDETSKMVVMHSGEDQADAAQELATKNAIQEIHDIGKGTYDVTITVGPSFQSKRQEAVASQLDFVRSAPETLPIVGDLIVRNMDWPQADEFADRMKKMLPPQLQDENEQGQAQMAQQAQMLMQQNQQLIQHVNDMTQQIKTKQVENQGKFNIAWLQERTKIVVAMINAKNALADNEAEKELQILGDSHDAAHEVAMHGLETQAQQMMQQAQQAHEQGQQASQQGADAQAQQADHSQENLQTAMQAATQPASNNGGGGQ